MCKIIRQEGLLAKRIRYARQKQSMSQSELARKLGVKPQAVQHWESGAANPKTDRLRNIALILEVPVSWLLADQLQNNTQSEIPVQKNADKTYKYCLPDERLVLDMYHNLDEQDKAIFLEIIELIVKKRKAT